MRKHLLLGLFVILCLTPISFTACNESPVEEATEEVVDEIDDATDSD